MRGSKNNIIGLTYELLFVTLYIALLFVMSIVFVG